MLTRRMAISVAAVLAMAALPAMAADMVDNPAYQSWSKFKVGAMAKATQEMTMGDQKTTTEMTSTLKELTADKAVIEIKTVTDAGGEKMENTQKIELAAKVAKSPEAATKPKTKEGTEEIEVAGKKLKCKWVETTVEQGGMKMTSKVWTSDEIPGTLAKMESKSEGQMSMTMVMRTVEFSKGK